MLLRVAGARSFLVLMMRELLGGSSVLPSRAAASDAMVVLRLEVLGVLRGGIRRRQVLIFVFAAVRPRAANVRFLTACVVARGVRALVSIERRRAAVV